MLQYKSLFFKSYNRHPHSEKCNRSAVYQVLFCMWNYTHLWRAKFFFNELERKLDNVLFSYDDHLITTDKIYYGYKYLNVKPLIYFRIRLREEYFKRVQSLYIKFTTISLEKQLNSIQSPTLWSNPLLARFFMLVFFSGSQSKWWAET